MWTADEIEDLTGKTTIVTGANSGIGFETARALALKGAHVVMACRNLEGGEEAASMIRYESPEASVEVMMLDLADLASVRGFAEEITGKFSSLDILCNNAGVMMIPERLETVDGYEMQFAINHLGHFALTGLLLDLLRRVPGSRVVTVSSSGHRFGNPDFDDLNAKKSYKPSNAYSLSKLANLLFTYELQRRLDDAGVDMIVAASHPGWTGTNLQRHAPILRFMNRFVSQKPDMGALPSLYAATAPDVQGGDYFGPSRFMEMRGYPKMVKSSKTSHDEEIAGRLWETSEGLTGVRYAF